jgi:hypothetical protein
MAGSFPRDAIVLSLIRREARPYARKDEIEVGVSETKAEESRAAQGASRSRGRSECDPVAKSTVIVPCAPSEAVIAQVRAEAGPKTLLSFSRGRMRSALI